MIVKGNSKVTFSNYYFDDKLMYFYHSSTITFKGNSTVTFTDNSANGNGGVMHIDDSRSAKHLEKTLQ